MSNQIDIWIPNKDFDIWLLRAILVPDADEKEQERWQPTRCISQALTLLYLYMKTRSDVWFNMSYDTRHGEDEPPYLVTLYEENVDFPLHDHGWILSMSICRLLAMAITEGDLRNVRINWS